MSCQGWACLRRGRVVAVVPDDLDGFGAVSAGRGWSCGFGVGRWGGFGIGLAALVSGEQRGPGSGCRDLPQPGEGAVFRRRLPLALMFST